MEKDQDLVRERYVIESFDAKGFSPGFKIKDAKFLGEGSFGCVLRAQVKKSEYGRGVDTIAVKFQLNLEGDALSEIHINEGKKSLHIEDRVISKRASPFLVSCFRSYRVTVEERRDAQWLDVLSRCSNVSEFLSAYSFPIHVYVMEMEYRPHGNLRAHLSRMASSGLSLKRDQIVSMTFQMTQALYSLAKSCWMRHQDVRSGNILVQVHQKSRISFNIFDESETGSHMLLFGESDCPFQLFLSDYGHCQYIDEYRIRPNRMHRPLINLVLKEESEEEWESCDVWSLGLLVIEFTLSGWKIPFASEADAVSHKIHGTYDYENILKIGHDNGDLRALAEKLTLEDRTKQISIRDALNVLCFMMLSRSLGIKAIEEESHTPFYRSMIDSESHIRSITTYGGINLFDEVVREIKTRLGEDGLDFIRRCLAWGHHSRANFGSRYPFTPEHTNELSRMFSLVMNHELFRSLKVQTHTHFGYK